MRVGVSFLLFGCLLFSIRLVAEETENHDSSKMAGGTVACRGWLLSHGSLLSCGKKNVERLGARHPILASIWTKQGNSLRKSDDFEGAVASYTRALELNPMATKAYYGRGLAYETRGDLDKAIADFTEAINLKATFAEAYEMRGHAHGSKFEYEAAIADENQAIELAPADAYAYHVRGTVYGNLNKLEQALADFREAIRLDPEYVEAYVNLGVVCLFKGNTDEAITHLNEAVRLDPEAANAYAYRALCFADKKDYVQAVADIDQAIQRKPNSSWYYELRAAIRIWSRDYAGGIADFQTMARLGQQDAMAKDVAENELPAPAGLDSVALEYGREQVRRMLQDRPEMARYGEKAALLYEWAARQFAGEAFGKRIVWDSSEPYTDANAENEIVDEGKTGARVRVSGVRATWKGVELEKPSFDTLWADAVFELYNVTNVKRFRAITEDNDAGKLSKEEFITRIVKAESLAALKARTFYMEVFLPWAKIHAVPTNPTKWYFVTTFHEKCHMKALVLHDSLYWSNYACEYDLKLLKRLWEKGENEKVIQLASELLHRVTDPNGASYWGQVYFYRGQTYRKIGKMDEALVDFDAIVRLFPDRLESYQYRGMLYVERREYGKAIADFDAILRLAPDRSEFYAYRGTLYNEVHEYGKAIADFTEAIRLDSENWKLYESRGLVYASKKEYGKAVTDHCKAIRLNPKNAHLFFDLSKIYVEMEVWDLAKSNIATAMLLDPSNAEIRQFRDWLDSRARDAAETSRAIGQQFSYEMKKDVATAKKSP